MLADKRQDVPIFHFHFVNHRDVDSALPQEAHCRRKSQCFARRMIDIPFIVT